jgi:periplasmic protein TonB
VTAGLAGNWRRWLSCGLVTVCAHGAVAGWLARRSDAMPSGAPVETIIVDLAPVTANAVDPTPPDNPAELEAPMMPPPDRAVAPRPPEQVLQAYTPATAPITTTPDPPPAAAKMPLAAKIKPQPFKPTPHRSTRVADLPAHPRPPLPAANPVARANWHSQVVSQIERNKRYPADVRQRDNGVTRVAFLIDRTGRVLAANIAAPSSSDALDQESLATIRRAAPFPAPPVDVPGNAFSFTVPIRYMRR